MDVYKQEKNQIKQKLLTKARHNIGKFYNNHDGKELPTMFQLKDMENMTPEEEARIAEEKKEADKEKIAKQLKKKNKKGKSKKDKNKKKKEKGGKKKKGK